MLIRNYLNTLMEPIGKRTLCFLINGKTNEVLLGRKKRGLGEGNYLGIGGKVEQGEQIEEAVIREVQEEVGVTPTNLEKMAVVTFLFPEKPHWNQEVHVTHIPASFLKFKVHKLKKSSIGILALSSAGALSILITLEKKIKSEMLIYVTYINVYVI